jgi:hypothetical protein
MAQGRLEIVDDAGYDQRLLDLYQGFVDSSPDEMRDWFNSDRVEDLVWCSGGLGGIPGAMGVPVDAEPSAHYLPGQDEGQGFAYAENMRQRTVGKEGGLLIPVGDPVAAMVAADRWHLPGMPGSVKRALRWGAEPVGGVVRFDHEHRETGAPVQIAVAFLVLARKRLVSGPLLVDGRLSDDHHAGSVPKSIKLQLQDHAGQAPEGYTPPLEPQVVANAINLSPRQPA